MEYGGVVGWVIVSDGWMKEEERKSAGGGGLSSSNATVVILRGLTGARVPLRFRFA